MLIYENPLPTMVEIDLLERIAGTMSESDVELVFCDGDEMQAINCEHRGIDKKTDVLSFPLETLEGLPLGSLVICTEVAEHKAQELGHDVTQEIALLFIHGMLHLLGYDHEKDQGEMREKEEAYIRQFGLPESLIVRTEDKGGR